MDGTNDIKSPLLDSERPEDNLGNKGKSDASCTSSSGEESPDCKAEEPIFEEPLGPSHEDPINHIAISKELFDKWRWFRLMYSVVAVAAIIPQAIDYESRFSRDRRQDECIENEDVSVKWRMLSLIMSIVAIVLMIGYRVNYFEWKRHHPKTFKDLPPMIQYPLVEYLNLRKPFTPMQYLGDEVPLTIFMLLFFPYPWVDFTVSVPQQINYEMVWVCYYVSEILYAMMYLRVYLLITGVFNYGKYFNPIAMRIGEKHGVRVTSNFAIKCYVNRKPLVMLLSLFLIPAVIVFGLIMRVFERPMMKANMDFDYVGNAWWNIIITMTTVGYGDTFPYTNLGRVIVACSAFWGGIILSLTFSTMSSFLQLKTNEQKALNNIIITGVACDAIGSVVSQKRRLKDGKNLWAKVRERLIVLREHKQDLNTQDHLSESTENISIKLYSLEEKTEKIRKLVQELSEKVSEKERDIEREREREN